MLTVVLLTDDHRFEVVQLAVTTVVACAGAWDHGVLADPRAALSHVVPSQRPM
jgi:hypothetical protein